jgi:hypothetical protein
MSKEYVASGGKQGKQASFHPPVTPMNVYMSAAARKKHPRIAALLKDAAAGKHLGGRPPAKVQLVSALLDMAALLKGAPGSCRWLIRGGCDPELDAIKEMVGGRRQKLVATVHQFSRQVGHQLN